MKKIRGVDYFGLERIRYSDKPVEFYFILFYYKRAY